ncbi:MAG: hypothetical protein HZA50_05035 [Planctomycetes bacterium]|nr:hypothetical protein [Planctomycetota bacterium]
MFNRKLIALLLASVSAAFASSAVAQEQPASQPATDASVGRAETLAISGFDDALPEGLSAKLAETMLCADSGVPAVGTGCLKIKPTPKAGKTVSATFPLPTGASPDAYAALSCFIRVSAKAGQVSLRWLAEDADGKTLFQRKFSAEKKDRWTRLFWPLTAWRWGSDRAGDWTQVKSITLVVESEAQDIQLDELAFTGSPASGAQADWLLKVAFGKKKHLTAGEQPLLVASSSSHKQPDMDKIAANFKLVETWMGRVLGDAVRPVGGDCPAALLIFADAKDWQGFFTRLAADWETSAVSPTGTGFTIQTYATSTYSDKFGWDRPVYLHEMCHALAARQLRLLNGVAGHWWLQEGLANYLQLCLYPSSLNRDEFAANFTKPVDQTGKGFFKPLKMLVTKDAGTQEYAQLASLIGYMLENKPQLLIDLVKATADGKKIAEAFDKNNVSLDDVEKAWFDWGAKTFAPDATPPNGPGSFFPVPEEWKDIATSRPASLPAEK